MTFILNFTKNKKEEISLTGIYSITNRNSNNFYIGSATRKGKLPSHSGFYYRWGKHIKDLRKGTHHCSHLQRAWNKYGEESFEFTILEFIEPEYCIEAEQSYLDLSDKSLLYNSRLTADSFAGCKRDAETVKKIVDSNSKSFLLINPEGIEVIGKNLKKFCRDNQLHQAGIQKVIKEEALHSLGWTKNIEKHLEFLSLKDLRGLHFDRKSNGWVLRLPARYSETGKRKTLGIFKDLEVAKQERNRIEKEYNFIFMVTSYVKTSN